MRVLIPEMRGEVRVQECCRSGAAIVGVGRAVLVHVRKGRRDEPEQQGQHRDEGARLAEHTSMVVGQSSGCQAPGRLNRRLLDFRAAFAGAKFHEEPTRGTERCESAAPARVVDGGQAVTARAGGRGGRGAFTARRRASAAQSAGRTRW
jgi:hypothetical protein